MTLCYITSSQADFDQLQQDINCVSFFYISEKYHQFNINKCRQLFISQKRDYSLPPPSFVLNGQVLTQVFPKVGDEALCQMLYIIKEYETHFMAFMHQVLEGCHQ